jgi:hypothetical protein
MGNALVVEVVVGAVNPKEVAGAVVGVEAVMGQTFLMFLWLCLAGDWW